MTSNEQTNNNDQLPISKNEDVEFSAELADEDDFEAMERAEEADSRQQNDEQ